MQKYIKSLAISVPLIISILISFASINYEPRFYQLPVVVILLSLLILIVDYKVFYQKIEDPRVSVSLSPKSMFFLKAFILSISFFCILDLYFHGMVLFSSEAGSYKTFTALEHRIRHISMLVWTFLPLSFFIRNKRFKSFLIVFPFAMLILFLDRSRIVTMLTATIVTYFLIKEKSAFKMKPIFIGILILVLGLVFSALGKFRKGASDTQLIEASYLVTTNRTIAPNCILPQSIPFSNLYNESGVRVKWVLAYVAVPIFNLSIQQVCDHRDSYALLNQIVPKWMKEFRTEYTVLISDQLNVATEFISFYLVMQYLGIVLALLIVYGSLYFSALYYLQRRTIFSFLILVKLLSTAIFLNFAPQFFVWTNFGFVLLFLAIDRFATSTKSDRFYFFLSNLRKKS